MNRNHKNVMLPIGSCTLLEQDNCSKSQRTEEKRKKKEEEEEEHLHETSVQHRKDNGITIIRIGRSDWPKALWPVSSLCVPRVRRAYSLPRT